MALAISGFEGRTLGCLFGREGGPVVLYDGGGGSLLTFKLLKAAVRGAAEAVALLRPELFKDDSEGRIAMI